jgi:Flp pilus assembly pilin Flp
VNSVKKLQMNAFSGKLFRSEQGQGIAEYALMLALLLSLMFIAHAVGIKANSMFSWVASVLQ